jgi:hypothetical protein
MSSLHEQLTVEQDYLSAEHRKMLEEDSSIFPEVISARGYRTVLDPQVLLELGFEEYQARTPGLLIPIRGTGEEVLFHRYRPDRPRARADKPGGTVKYEQPPNTSLVLDVPPTCREYLRDTSRRLWILEGEKKSDCLASQGEVAVAVLGVWGWKKDGCLLPGWDDVATIGREILIAFDSDTTDKYEVMLARHTLGRALEGLSGHAG